MTSLTHLLYEYRTGIVSLWWLYDFSYVWFLVRIWVTVKAEGNIFDFFTKYALTMETLNLSFDMLFKCFLNGMNFVAFFFFLKKEEKK